MEEIYTTRGMMDITLLTKKEGDFEDDNEITKWVEYWYEGELVKRSVHVHLKKNVIATAFAAEI